MEKKTGSIKLEDLLKTKIIYERKEKFEHSAFRNVYDGAKQAVEEIVLDNCRYRRSKGETSDEISNVISFIGRRGTGKSSCMLSFLRSLKEGEKKRPDDCGERKVIQEKKYEREVCYFTLDCIDAAILEESESVFTLVLANMLDRIEKCRKKDIDDYIGRSLLQRLEKIYKNYQTLKYHKHSEGEYSAYESLREIASSQKIREEFANLVEEYLEYFTYSADDWKTKDTEAYLVIAIDDLDMSHYNKRKSETRNTKVYEIMWTISTFFSVPKVIVLTSYNHVNLNKQCIGFFLESDTSYNQTVKDNDKSVAYKSSEKLAIHYMEKVFAPRYRLYMPSWKKKDYVGETIRIDVGDLDWEHKEAIEDIFTPFREQREHVYDTKRLMLILYAKTVGIYYDCEGKKRHFVEPDSLRELSDNVRMLYYCLSNFDAPSTKEHKRIELKEMIFKRVKDDVYFRFIQESLNNVTELGLFEELLEYPIDRRSERIVSMISPQITPLGKEEKRKIRERNISAAEAMDPWEYEVWFEYRKKADEIRNKEKVKYSYAELVHCIYHMTRQEQLYSKDFAACLLNSYSVYLNQIYNSYREKRKRIKTEVYIKWFRSEKPTSSTEYVQDLGKETLLTWEEFQEMMDEYELLKGVIGTTVFGHWTEYLFSEIQITDLLSATEKKNLTISCFEDVNEAQFSCEFRIKEDKDEIDRMLDLCFFWMTMYTDLLEWKELKIGVADSDFGSQEIRLEYKGVFGFELTAFLRYAILYPDYLRKVEELLRQAFEKITNEEIKKKVLECLQIKFDRLWNDYCAWDFNYGNMILPIQHFDLSYNLIKHLCTEREKKSNGEVGLTLEDSSNVFFGEFDRMKGRILNYLKKIDVFFLLEDEKSLYNIFEQCPFVQILIEIQNDKYKIFNNHYIHNILAMSLNNKENLPDAPDEGV